MAPQRSWLYLTVLFTILFTAALSTINPTHGTPHPAHLRNRLTHHRSQTHRSRLYPIPSLSQCVTPGQFAMTFDDGPSPFTKEVLGVLREKGVVATFFVTGFNNGRRIEDYAEEIQTIVRDGHMIASHTHTHPYLPKLTEREFITEITTLENALYNIVQLRPAYFRPPYGEITDRQLDLLGRMGFKASIMWSIDTNDWRHPTPTPQNIALSLSAYASALTTPPTNGSFIALQHDIQPVTADVRGGSDFVERAVELIPPTTPGAGPGALAYQKHPGKEAFKILDTTRYTQSPPREIERGQADKDVCAQTPGTQVVANPSFESAGIWSISTTGGVVAFTLFGNPFDGTREFLAATDPPGGTAIASQTVTVCPGRRYQYSLYVGVYTAGVNAPTTSTVTLALNGADLFPASAPCGNGLIPTGCTATAEQGTFYRQITGEVVPTVANPSLEIKISYTHPGIQVRDTLVDLVTLTLLE
ncbi:hypothetical protein HK102_013084 [Quaeritorhiza haematococci]|nr:hypothetical protein HK102_013084 [Quaeritorhiza haematococci]